MAECPITLCQLHELSFPVAFSDAPEQPYELEELCVWLEKSSSNPVTGEEVDVSSLIPLGSVEQQRKSARILRRIIPVHMCLREMKDIKAEIEGINSAIKELNKKINSLFVEKTVLEFKLNNLRERVFNNGDQNNNQCPDCSVS